MNERIKELETQSWEERQYGPPWFNSTKFAQLILEDIEELIANRICSVQCECQPQYAKLLACLSTDLNEHFGNKA